ncbi:hypothetical protein HK107_14015 [Parvularcula sp. ZS-1/3]|uniref:Tissue inhibitor of metalloproteinase n=1 Tax=Parvularcula mediterranea TaxID=2732508 RepID=A0A7Y3RNN9_9PROT|nr:hypothetical protein [Parvularcula mediterranea]NNU17444.1 hypothetical protein [Parvularcula mediterranea]
MRSLIALAAALLAASGVASACSCPGFDSLAEHWERVDVVFEGKAMRSITVERHAAPLLMTTFRLGHAWKGELPEIVSVKHRDGRTCCLCGMNYEVGETVLVFAIEHDDGSLSTSSCSAPRGTMEQYLVALGRRDIDPDPDALGPDGAAHQEDVHKKSCDKGEDDA